MKNVVKNAVTGKGKSRGAVWCGVVLGFLLVNCSGQKKSDETKHVDLESIYEQNMRDSVLATGWYYILESENGFSRQLEKSDAFYFIDPKPILVKEHFKVVKIETNFQGNDYLSIQTYERYKNIWADATEKSIGKQLGFIIDNKLVYAPKVNARIESGMASLWAYDKKELENFKKQLE